jgi:hypothetical protein
MQGKQLQFEGLEDEAIPMDVYARRFERDSLKSTAEHMTKGHWEDVMLIPNYRESGKWVVVFRPHLEEYIERVNLFMDRCEATILEATSDS